MTKRMISTAAVLFVAVGLAASSGALARGNNGGGQNAAARKEAGPGQRFERIRQILEKLNLSADQQKAIDQILNDAQNQLRTLRAQVRSGGDRSAIRGQVRTILKDTRAKIEQQLTPEQRTQFDAALKELKKEAVAKHRGQDQSGPTTQPQD